MAVPDLVTERDMMDVLHVAELSARRDNHLKEADALKAVSIALPTMIEEIQNLRTTVTALESRCATLEADAERWTAFAGRAVVQVDEDGGVWLGKWAGEQEDLRDTFPTEMAKLDNNGSLCEVPELVTRLLDIRRFRAASSPTTKTDG